MERESERRLDWRCELLPALVVVGLTSIYLLSFFNRFAGLRSGDGEFGGGVAFLAGLRPYRDYFTAGPPLNVFKSALELAVFGKLLIVSRAFAVVERLAIAATLYVWLRKSFTQGAAALGAFVTIVASAGDHTDPLASYNHDAIFLAMLCGLTASYAIEARGEGRVLMLAALAGVFGALSLLTKQTVGAFAITAVALCGGLAEAMLHSVSRASKWVLCFALGVVLPVFGLAVYLKRLGVLHACVEMLFVSGPKAKASHPLAFLARDIMIAGLYRWWLLLALAMVVMGGAALHRSIIRPKSVKLAARTSWLVYFVAGACVFMAAKEFAVHSHMGLQNSGKAAVYYVLFGVSFIAVIALQEALHSAGVEQKKAFQITMFSALSLAVAVSLSMSFPAFEAMLLPGLGLLVAATYDGAHFSGKCAVVSVCVLLVFFQIAEKLTSPFGFDHQDEGSVRVAVHLSAQPMLIGMRLPESTARLIDDVQQTVRERAGASGTVFTYPEMGLLYSLSGRYPPTRTASHNIDVVNDQFARSEAARLLASPPAVIVYAKPSEVDMHVAELVWREGQASGQRSIIDAVDRIVAHYDLLGTYQLTPQDTPVRVYARPLR